MNPYIILFGALVFLGLAMAVGFTWEFMSNREYKTKSPWRRWNTAQKVAYVVGVAGMLALTVLVLAS